MISVIGLKKRLVRGGAWPGVAWRGCPKRLGIAEDDRRWNWSFHLEAQVSTIVTVDMHAYFARASPANLAFLCDSQALLDSSRATSSPDMIYVVDISVLSS